MVAFLRVDMGNLVAHPQMASQWRRQAFPGYSIWVITEK